MGTIGGVKKAGKAAVRWGFPALLGASAGSEIHRQAQEEKGSAPRRYGVATKKVGGAYARDLGPYYLAEKAFQAMGRGGLGWGLLAADVGLMAAGEEPISEMMYNRAEELERRRAARRRRWKENPESIPSGFDVLKGAVDRSLSAVESFGPLLYGHGRKPTRNLHGRSGVVPGQQP